MSRRHDDPVSVRTGRPSTAGGVRADDVPREFTWRGRRYVVCAVLTTWQERRAWWREVGERALPGLPEAQRRVWRVEARPPVGSAGVFDLGRDDDHRWLLLRTHD